MFRILVSCGKGWADPENPVPNERKEKKSTELPVEEAEKPNSTHRYWNAYSCMTSARWLHCTQCKQGLPSSCRLVDVVLEHRLLTPRACHPPRSLPTWHCLNCSMKHLIIIWQTGAASQRHQLSMARYLRLNQPTCRLGSQKSRQRTAMESFQPHFAPSPTVSERGKLRLCWQCPA